MTARASPLPRSAAIVPVSSVKPRVEPGDTRSSVNERRHRAVCGVGDTGSHVRPRHEGGQPRGEFTRVGNQLGAACVIQRGVDFGEIRYMRPVEDGGAELGRLDRILPAVPD